GCERRERIIVDIRERVCPRARIGGKLMNRGEANPFVTRYDGLRAVAMMPVEVPDGDALGAIVQCIEGGNSDVVKITKSHRPVGRGMMSRRAHEAKRPLAAQRCLRRFNGRACGSRG